ncbi:hypothetical protein EG328_011404 [Venturia inaequalis]|uniref:Metal-dependent protein hydrolase n=1 Tax=Venturia inaequalis TaxID=5025 RepID=A0A8H3V462_VENIN|nr:hypothetical protein EG328_011404 [Venturia inaequalis]
MTDPLPKRQKTSPPLIGTHNGHFHADEALAVWFLRQLATYKDSNLVRTRDQAVLDTCHTVVDVGGEYSHEKNRYDHHQRGFEETFDATHKTKLSAAGLVYKHLGKDIIARQTGLAIDSQDAELLYQKLYDDLVEAFDANDNGISVYDSKAILEHGIEKRFEDSGFTLASYVGSLNHSLPRAAEDDSAEVKQQKEDKRFERASTFVGELFAMKLEDKFSAWLPARAKVLDAFNDRTKHDASGKIMVLHEGLPWADHLYKFEASTSTPEDQKVLYVLFPESDQADSKWRIRSVSMEGAGFTNRRDLPDAWKGLRDEELDKVSGIPGGVFIHASGFIGGNKTFDGALAMAKKAIA